MPKRRLILGFLAAALLAAPLIVLTRSREPAYEGQPLSVWVTALHPDHSDAHIEHKDAVVAVRRMGRDAVPYLLRWLQEWPRPWSTTTISLAAHLPRGRVQTLAQRLAANLAAKEAARATLQVRRVPAVTEALRILSAEAAAAIPELTSSLNQPTTGQFDVTPRHRKIGAAQALGAIGDQGLPSLLAATTSPQESTRFAAVMGIIVLGTNGLPAVSALTKLLVDPQPNISYIAQMALLKIAPEVLTTAPPK